MATALGGIGGSSISSMIRQLDGLSPEDIENYGIYRKALETMIGILERIENIIDDGIQPEEVDDLQGLLKSLAGACNCEISTVEALQKQVHEIKEDIDEMERYAPGLLRQLTAKGGQSGQAGLSADAIQGVSELAKGLDIDQAQSVDPSGTDVDADSDNSDDAAQLFEMMQRHMLDRRGGSLDRNNVRKLIDSLKEKLNKKDRIGVSPINNQNNSQADPMSSKKAVPHAIGTAHGVAPSHLNTVRSNHDQNSPANIQERTRVEDRKHRDLDYLSDKANQIEEKMDAVSMGAANAILGSLAEAISSGAALNTPLNDIMAQMDDILGGL